MRAGVTASVIAHAALIVWGVFSLAPKPLDAGTLQPVRVDLVTIDSVTAAPKAAPPIVPPTPAPVARPVTQPTPDPAPPAPPVVAKADPQPVPKPPSPAPMPLPAPKPVAAPAPTTVAAAPPAPTVSPPKPQVAPKPPVTKPATSDAIAAVLNQPQPKPAAQPSPQPPRPDAAALDSLIATAAVDTRMTESEVDALRARIAACWTPPPGWSDPGQVRVVVIISLNADGSVSGTPQIVQAPTGPYQQTAPESAVRAVLSCAPYTLPAQKYDDWKQVEITFDPQAMRTG